MRSAFYRANRLPPTVAPRTNKQLQDNFIAGGHGQSRESHTECHNKCIPRNAEFSCTLTETSATPAHENNPPIDGRTTLNSFALQTCPWAHSINR